MDKITPDIVAHFGRNKALMNDYLNYSRDDFIALHPSIPDYEYINTTLYCLECLDIINTTFRPIGLIDGYYIKKKSKEKTDNPYYLLTICS